MVRNVIQAQYLFVNSGTLYLFFKTFLMFLFCLSSFFFPQINNRDGKNTADLKDFVKYVTDDRKRSMVESVIKAFQTNILDTIKTGETTFEKSIIHGDFNDANFLLNDNFQVSGVIDFGDSVER